MTTTPQHSWLECKEFLKQKIPLSLYNTFIEPIKIDTNSTQHLQLQSPGTPQTIDHIQSRYIPLIEQYLRENRFQGQVRLQNPQAASPILDDTNSDSTTRTNHSADQHSTQSIEEFWPAKENKLFIEHLYDQPLQRALFLFGNSGCGKTHLGRLLGHKRQQKGQSALFLSLETFLTDFSLACRKRDTVKWRQHLRQHDTIIIDDFQFLKSTAHKSAEELLHLIDEFQHQHKEIVFLSTMPAVELKVPNLLASRLRSLTHIQLEYPDLTGRVVILQRSLSRYNLQLMEQHCQYIAKRIPNDIRLLKAVAERFMLWSMNQNELQDLTPEKIQQLLGDLFIRRKAIEPSKVLEKVAQVWGVQVTDITSADRSRKLSMARQVVAWLCTEELGMQQKETAQLIGRQDHGTVIHARKKVEQMLQKDLFFANQLLLIKQELFQY